MQAEAGPEHSSTATALNNLGLLLQAPGRLAEAEPLMRRIVEILIVFSKQGYHHPKLNAGLINYIALLQAMGLPEPDIQAKLQALQPPT